MSIDEFKQSTAKIAALPPREAKLAAQIAIKLSSLGAGSYFNHHISGALVDSFYFRLTPTTPLAKVIGRGEDLAFATESDSAVILREKGLVNIQIAKPVAMRRVIDFNTALFKLASKLLKTKVPIILGQTHQGEYALIDLVDQPHMLIAGATNSGKSMFLLSTICGIAASKSPSEVQIVVVDSKQVDLTLTQGIPHITRICRNALDLHEALDSLQNEMRRRNALMSGLARNLEEYNSLQRGAGCPELARIVLIIDEFADLIEEDYSQAKSKIEPYASLTRLGERLRFLAQLSRASGIHIIAATQRPSVRITSGDLKANLPCRVSFKLPSIHDSKTVLKESGAENLLGRGDMLVQAVGEEKMFRAHAPFVDMNTLGAILANTEGVRQTLTMVGLVEAQTALETPVA